MFWLGRNNSGLWGFLSLILVLCWNLSSVSHRFRVFVISRCSGIGNSYIVPPKWCISAAQFPRSGQISILLLQVRPRCGRNVKTTEELVVVNFEVASSSSFQDVPKNIHFVTADINDSIMWNAYANVSHKCGVHVLASVLCALQLAATANCEEI